MRNATTLKSAAVIAAAALLFAGCSGSGGKGHSGMDHSSMGHNMETGSNNATNTGSTERLTGTAFNLTAQVSKQELAPGITLPVWTFNNSVPGPQIRVKQGNTVTINLKNELPAPTSIHWHGVPVPNAMDGIPGVTQNAVQPGETFTYTFKAEAPGTYWYHSHQDSANQTDRGLYGSFVVEAKDGDKPDRDYTLMLDEWVSAGTGDKGENMAGMDHGTMNMSGSNTSGSSDMGDTSSGHGGHGASNEAGMNMGHDMSMYDLFTINGKSGSAVEQLPVKKGEKVRIRLINAGFLSHQIHLHGHEFKVVTSDGQPFNNPAVLKDTLVNIAPGERYDLEFVADNPGQWLIEDHSGGKAGQGLKAVIGYEGASAGTDKPDVSDSLPLLDITRYGEASAAMFTLDQTYSKSYDLELNTAMKNGSMVYTINGSIFPDIPPVNVKKGDTVKVRMVNNSPMDDHPMHLHGHFFQVLSKNGKPLEGSPVIKDTLNLKPGEEYVVAFKADNEGNWMFHCHDLHHAAAGMVAEVKYDDFKTNFVPDPNAGNMPE
ncbi:multicopper oxidase family protein [Paenibacillus beijingensis]|uniref:Multicopper oxidase n=1 Tax=Paenibacillus beijingensis TaxID=1126833 RepID=A0A0D5NEB8_9BACL|nr:multicopper oxidase family protein [Paenibacillus beijingensis]AJY73505.1 multicopper oxidase [Paenibacillus beijingensis]